MPAIEFYQDGNLLVLRYKPAESFWVAQNLKSNQPVPIRRTFEFEPDDLIPPALEEDDDELLDDEGSDFHFALGERVGEYFRINPRVVDTTNAFFFHESIELESAHFVAERNVSILKKIDSVIKQDVYVGGSADDAMPWPAYGQLVAKFPNSYELRRYADARVGACVRDYFETATDTELLFEKYMNKRMPADGGEVLDVFRSQEAAKYQTLAAKLRDMLANEPSYSEKQWQDEILNMIRLIYPKYVLVFSGTPVFDSVRKKQRFLDLLLVDSSGSVDLIEIKRPFDKCVVSERQYRDNYIPLKELSGAVMQIEKYILYLNKWGQRGEDDLNKRYRRELKGMRLKIINPKGIIIMGREVNLSPEQRDDFEVIKRKYSNVIDIVTYDDLLSRLDFTVRQLES